MTTKASHLKFAVLFLTGLVAFFATGMPSRAGGGKALHREVLVFVPAYEATQLFDPTLDSPGDDPVCVWGNYNVFLSSKRYFALRMPNPLTAKPLLAVGPIDVYRRFVSTLTERSKDFPDFAPYTRGADFFIFNYDWRQEIATVSAPALDRALLSYARIHERRTGIPAAETKFIVVSHSMGGLVVRTLLSEKPALASRISRFYMVGSPNAGSVKALRTVVVGPESIEAIAQGFPGVALNLVPTDVDQKVTKLVGITRPSLYELLPFGDPHWTALESGNHPSTRTAADVLEASSWEPYWPSAELEKKLFIDGWLKDREEEGRKTIRPSDWEFCQDPAFGKLKELLAETSRWRQTMGRLSATDLLLTGPKEASRLRVIFSDGLQTPTGVVTSGTHDGAAAYYRYDPPNSGDGTMEAARVLDDIPRTAANVFRLHGVPHGKLMIDSQFLNYLTKELSGAPMAQTGS